MSEQLTVSEAQRKKMREMFAGDLISLERNQESIIVKVQSKTLNELVPLTGKQERILMSLFNGVKPTASKSSDGLVTILLERTVEIQITGIQIVKGSELKIEGESESLDTKTTIKVD